MLTKFRLRNFRCFEDTGEMDLRPLTLFVGPNSSGKSSILHLLLALKQTVESRDINTAFVPNDNWVRLGAYHDFIYRHDFQRELEVELEFVRPLSPHFRESPIKMCIRWRYIKKTTQIRLEESQLETDEGREIQRIFWDNNSKRHKAYVKPPYPDRPEWQGEVEPLSFYDFRPKFRRKKEAPQFPFETAGKFLVRHFLFGRLLYLGPLREYPQRSYVISGQAPPDVGVRGERSAEVLWFATRTKERRRQMLEQVNRWVKEFGIAEEVRLQRLGKSNQYQVLFVDPATGTLVNIADVGFGSSQLLPIIVQGFYAPPGSILLIEQPEIHLHPKAQAALGDLLIAIAQQGDRQIIVETHSEHVLARIQRRIAEQKLSREQVAIYYFHPALQGTQVKRIELDEYGQFVKPLPEGFFEEGLEDAFAHIRAIGKRKAAEVGITSERVDD